MTRKFRGVALDAMRGRIMGRSGWIGIIFSAMMVLAACGDEVAEEGGTTCPEGQDFNPITGQCAPGGTEGPPPSSNNPVPGPGPGEDLPPSNNSPAPPNPDPPAPGEDPCDMDGDGYISVACGGDDCDDNDRFVHTGAAEVCSFQDNNCDGTINSGLDCSFYAHTTSNLYRVDPFLKTSESLGALPATLFDIDTHPNGVLYGITTTTLYKLEPGSTQWQTVGSMGTIGNANGLCIDSNGKAYITASNSLYTVDLSTAQSSRVGSMGLSYNSSGDCVINKADTLYMTSSGIGHDKLVLIDGDTARVTEIGSTGFSEIYALTAAWSYLFGLTGQGHLISLDPQTGQGQLLHTFSGKTWYGAASTPGR